MNPALRIWSFALLFCLVFVIVVSIINPMAAGFLTIIFLIVAFASIVSLIGFYLLFEALRQVSSSQWIFWIGSFLFVPVIVYANAWLLMLAIDNNFSLGGNNAGSELLVFAAVPLAATLLSMLVRYKRINEFLSQES